MFGPVVSEAQGLQIGYIMGAALIQRLHMVNL
jgi:hypothetical protein